MTQYDYDAITQSAIDSWLYYSPADFDFGSEEGEVESLKAEYDFMMEAVMGLEAKIDPSVTSAWASAVENFMREAEPIFDEIQSRGGPLFDIGHDLGLGGYFRNRGYPEDLAEQLFSIGFSTESYNPWITKNNDGKYILLAEGKLG